MATTINSRSASSDCSIGAMIANGESLSVNVRISWNYNFTAPQVMGVRCSYDNNGQTFTDSRQYSSDGSYNTEGKIPCPVFDSTFNDALKALVLECFANYSNVNLIGEEE